MTVCLDITSIGVPRSRWTGVARMSWDLAMDLLRRDRMDIRFSSVGTVAAELVTQRYLSEIGLQDRFVARQPGRALHGLLAATGRSGAVGKGASNMLRVWNRLRKPLDPAALPEMEMFFSFYAGIPAQLREAGIPCGIYVHDIIPFLFPQFCTEQQQRVLRRILDSIRPGDLIAVNSECTKRDLCDHVGMDPADIVTVHLAADTKLFRPVDDSTRIADVRARYGIPEGDYFLTLHSAAPHKNMPLLIRAHAAYRAARGPEALPLVIAGGKGDPQAEIQATGEVTEDALAGVIFAGFIDDVDLAPLYSKAQAFFFPSLYEGFGLPVLEALFCGVPAFSSDRASLPEVMAPLALPHGGADRLLDAQDETAWAHAFARAEQAPRLMAGDIATLHEHFSWDRAGQILAEAIRDKILSKGSETP